VICRAGLAACRRNDALQGAIGHARIALCEAIHRLVDLPFFFCELKYVIMVRL